MITIYEECTYCNRRHALGFCDYKHAETEVQRWANVPGPRCPVCGCGFVEIVARDPWHRVWARQAGLVRETI